MAYTKNNHYLVILKDEKGNEIFKREYTRLRTAKHDAGGRGYYDCEIYLNEKLIEKYRTRDARKFKEKIGEFTT